ncbi:GTP cyclohydrolase II [Paroceanicella profunda]|uniref:GTP cyclohydrolase-2 n=1 Tax=Paroceanicella profunda TaxID=2579971 RepID=A0A5B8FUI1_9RHOB|nr:GTP cyclohydrolase II [Paroceanicella profunda]QDL90874.1 GTP cyclohydrolase II [Paroceanicella profunda]
MTFHLSAEERVARAQADFRIGLPVLLRAGEARLLALAAETLTADRLAELRSLGGEIDVVVTARRAETLRARAYDGDIARIAVPADVAAAWLRATADPASDLKMPMKGPYATRRGGDAALARVAVHLAKQAHLLPAAVTLVGGAGLEARALEAGLCQLSVADVARAQPEAMALEPVADARVPLEVSEAGRVHVFRPRNGGEEHYAVEIGTPDRRQPVLSRLHSACFTGDLIGSLKCDCGPQLRAALAQIGAEGAGVLLYLNQEGRGIGLANKMRAYSLQDQGFDTVEANHRIGFEDDERDFRIGAEILKRMGFSAVRLMTNNPRKVSMMEGAGVAVAERVPLRVGENPHNRGYLAVKAAKSGHLL